MPPPSRRAGPQLAWRRRSPREDRWTDTGQRHLLSAPHQEPPGGYVPSSMGPAVLGRRQPGPLVRSACQNRAETGEFEMRFGKGQSGNPKGRPRGSLNLPDIRKLLQPHIPIVKTRLLELLEHPDSRVRLEALRLVTAYIW